ncbi:hypothetical protein [Algoriphagus boritolerans]|uniref:Uncharacterized protein n=1 Tax=Algoriphagus boritolerans DSM 17298 = JCM 18970 TaxID=1120964 RepID=A0A1H5ZIM2_9BACT|nr:hypothetical protein [Algoriphagus boritolerans]SEG35615.1 hypothetical protein SAMN03080598_03512 [Algoriphagus boritolerans DSM 17298 = JCM 18970]
MKPKNLTQLWIPVLRTWLHSVLIFLILLNGMGYTFIQVNFYLDRKQITALYCVNKDKPELQCDGKCELGKRLSEAKNQTEGQTEITLEELRLVFPEQITLNPIVLKLKDYLELHPNSFYKKNLTTGSEMDFFHPPQLVFS